MVASAFLERYLQCVVETSHDLFSLAVPNASQIQLLNLKLWFASPRLLLMRLIWLGRRWILRGSRSLILRLISRGSPGRALSLRLCRKLVGLLLLKFLISLNFKDPLPWQTHFFIADVQGKWEKSSWGRKLIVQKKRASLNDFDRFKLMLAKIKVCDEVFLDLLHRLWVL